MFKKYCTFLYTELLLNNGQDFLDTQHYCFYGRGDVFGSVFMATPVLGNLELNRGLDCDVIVAEVRATSHKPDEIYGIIER